MTIRAGELNKRLTLRRAAPDDALGRSSDQAVDVARVWAKIETPSGRMLEAAQSKYALTDVRITLRYRTDARAGMLLFYPATGESFWIGHADDEDRRHETIVCLCSSLATIEPPASP